jgi:hypothetical protein
MAVVYQHRRLDDNTIFYIGIGKDKYRAYSKCGRNTHWKNIVNKVGYAVDILIDGCTIDDARVVEIGMISDYGRADLKEGQLVNMADGGASNPGTKGTWLGKTLSPEHKEKLRLAKLGKKRGSHSEETKLKISVSHKGKVLSEETKEKLRVINTGKKHSEETKQKLREIASNSLVNKLL